MPLSPYRSSLFIRALLQNGYGDTLATLLHDMDLDKLTCDTDAVADLLINISDNNAIEKIGIENSIIICDELYVPKAVRHIINNRMKLNKLLEHQIINHCIGSYIDQYNRGYKIIINSTDVVRYSQRDAQSINNAYRNGLYAPCAYVSDREICNDIMQCVFDDIRILIHSNFKNTVLCNNAQEILGLLDDGSKPLPFAKNIKNLTISQFNDNCINLGQFTELRKLCINDNQVLCSTQLPPTLDILYVYSNANVCDSMIRTCIRLKELRANGNPNITTCAPFARHLVVLDANWKCGIDDDGLRTCNRLKILHAGGNPKITTCVPFAKTLRRLYAYNTCGITDDEIPTCKRLKTLHAAGNPKISTCFG